MKLSQVTFRTPIEIPGTKYVHKNSVVHCMERRLGAANVVKELELSEDGFVMMVGYPNERQKTPAELTKLVPLSNVADMTPAHPPSVETLKEMAVG